MDDYLAAIEGTGIKHAVYMEVDVDPAQQQAEAEHLIEICKSGKAPTIAAVVSGRPAADGFQAYVTQFKGSPYIKGHSPGAARRLHAGGLSACRTSFVRGMRLLGELGLSFDLCLRPKELADGAKLAEKCPETRFIVDHCGNADPKAFFKAGDPRLTDAKPDHDADAWRRDIERLAAQKNVDLQNQRHRRPRAEGVVGRRPRADRQSLPRFVRPGPRHFWQRLARLPQRRAAARMGRRPQADHRRPPRRRAAASSCTTTPQSSTGWPSRQAVER